jgi:hypothetical protein
MVRPFVKGDSLEHRRYGRRFVGVLVLGHVFTAGVVVAMVQLIGTLTFAHISLDVRVWACAVAAVGGVSIDTRAFVRRRFSVCVARQTPKKLMHDPDRPWWLTPLLWGVDTGTMMSTYRVSFSSWILLLSALLAVAPAWSGFLFGASFGIPLIVNMFLGDPARFGREGDRARIWKPRLAQIAGIGTLLALPIGLTWINPPWL